jgi:CTP:molybdopterin cytidylyltransferase MocA
MAARTEEVSGIVLAAGAGARMGGPKALLLVEGEPLGVLHARRLGEAGCGAVVLVTRVELAARLGGEWSIAVSTAPDPAGSLGVGVRALEPGPADVIIVTPVDAWPARPETLARLVAAVRQGADAATPTHAGRGGHPVALRARVLAPFRDAPRPLRDVLAALGPGRVRIEVDDPGVAIDLDSPEDVLRVTGAPPRFA